MKILVTGANGLLGHKLIALLSAQEEVETIATSRGACRLPNEFNYIWRSMDIENREEVLQVFEETQPEVVIHTAAMTNVDQCETDKPGCWRSNVTATEILVEAAGKAGAFFLHLSTDFIFDGSRGPLTEEETPGPVNYYGESKLASEEIVMKSTLDWAIARTVLVYGITPSLSRSNIILWVKKSLEEGKTIQVVDDQWRTPTLAEDLAMGCWLIARKKAKGVFNISGKDMLTPYQMAVKSADFFNLDKKLMVKTDSSIFKQPAARPLKTGFVLDKARKELDYAPHSFDEGIAIVARQFDEAGKAD